LTQQGGGEGQKEREKEKRRGRSEEGKEGRRGKEEKEDRHKLCLYIKLYLLVRHWWLIPIIVATQETIRRITVQSHWGNS
jgi:hypothetical protein